LLHPSNPGLFKGQFTAAQVGEIEAPQARGSRRRRRRWSGVWGGGVPLPTELGGWGGGCAHPQKKSLTLALKMMSFGAFWIFLHFSQLFYMQNRCNLVHVQFLCTILFSSTSVHRPRGGWHHHRFSMDAFNIMPNARLRKSNG